MMNGYSITEAASVLGVPTERVWELLARGVLAGAPEGETGMRVFLQPRPAPAPVTAVPEEHPGTPRPNGPEREMSPFRELLTEFRNLTERYGQALLALGESRGEVASLRSRVDLLEARIDLRLPMGPPAATQWPTQPLPVSEAPTATPHGEVATEPEAEEEHRRRRRRGRRATESFAEALARAEDPSPADLPEAGGRAEADVEDADRSLPRDALPAEAVLVADEAEPEPAAAAMAEEEPAPSIAAVREPAGATLEPTPEADTFEAPGGREPETVSAGLLDEGDEGWDAAVAEAVESEEPKEPVEDLELEAPLAPVEAADTLQAELPSEPEPSGWSATEEAPERPGIGESEPAAAETSWGQEPEEALLEVESIDVEALPDISEPEPVSDAAGPPVEPDTVSDAAASDEPAAEEAADAADFDADRYSTVIEQPDWFEAEVDDEVSHAPPGDETVADIAESAPEAEPLGGEEEAAPEPTADGSQDAGAPTTPDVPEGLADAPAEIGADEMEVAGGGQGPSAPAGDEPQTGGLPGSHELDEALEAYGDLAPRRETSGADEEEWPPASGGAERFTPSAQRAAGYLTGSPRPMYGTAVPGSPATRAYRRLRRIFPT